MAFSLSTLWRRHWRQLRPAKQWTLGHRALADWRRRGEEVRALTDGGLDAAVQALKARIQSQTIDNLAAMVEAGALASEAIRRTVQIELFDTQLLAGLVLAHGHIAQMQTGEGKTLSGGAPILYAALQGRGVHVMLPNAYLAERDAGILGPAFKLLGITSGLLREKDDDRARQRAYQCDVTYGAGYEFGFDYLRDQLVQIECAAQGLGAEFEPALRGAKSASQGLRQRKLAWAVIDEADSILLDEATVPMILSGGCPPKANDDRPFHVAQQLAETLRAGVDFECEVKSNRLTLTEAGQLQIAPALTGLGGVQLQRPWHDYVEKALAANHIFLRDTHYVVIEGKVVIVDESTGRLHADRSWRDGLHQAIEIKERLPISGQARTLAQISRQRFLRQYDVVCGMTGTAEGSEAELLDAYGLEVVRVPTRKPSLRIQHPDRYFVGRESKWRAAAQAIAEVQRLGRPILVGSRTIQASEGIAQVLSQMGITCQLLNGKQSADEAALVARAGQAGMATVATNMAGRGTDIRLGPGVAELGGLHLVGLERNTSPRADAQLAGRVARQGDPGSCQFFVSSDDAVLQRFAPRLAREMTRMPNRDGEILADLSTRIAQAQNAAEAACALQRKRVRAQDLSLNETIGRLYHVS